MRNISFSKERNLRPEIKPTSICASGEAHRWRIGEVHGKTSEGKCLKCGKTRTFENLEPWGLFKPD